MQFNLPKLTVLLSAAIIIVISCTLIISMIMGVNKRQEEIKLKSITDIKRQLSILTHTAERILHIDPNFIFEDISQNTTDPRVSFSAVVNSQHKILFATDFSKTNQPVNSLTEFYYDELYKKSSINRTAQLKIKDESITAYMSFPEPAKKDEVRSLNRGIIILNFDLKHDREKIFNFVLRERILEIIATMFLGLAFFFFLKKYVSTPISLLENAAHTVTEGNYHGQQLDITGPVEIKNLTQSFNKMTASLQQHINYINEQKKHTETVIENVVDGIITIDTHGVIISFNKASESMFNYSAAEIIGKNINQLMPESFHNSHDGYIQKYIQTGNAKDISAERVLEGKKKNGETFPIELGISEFELNNQRNFIGIIRDITEKYRNETIKREFVSTVSHELRTPLTALQGAIALVSSGVLGDLPEKATIFMLNAKRNGDRLLKLINDLLDMDKILEGKIELNLNIYDVHTLISEAIDANLSYAQSHSVSFNITGDSTPYNIKTDNMRFHQVLSNFLSNACKYSDVNKSVDIGVKKINSEMIQVYVTDYGDGIPDDFNSIIFEKFSQVDSSDTRKKGGTGLGLAISKELIELMSGEIGFSSREKQGSTFYFNLPLAV